MKLADLPGRVVRPLGEWEEPAAPKFERPKTLKRTLKARVRDLLAQGVTSAPEMVKALGVTHQAIYNNLRALEAEGKAACVKVPRDGARGSNPNVWVAL